MGVRRTGLPGGREVLIGWKPPKEFQDYLKISGIMSQKEVLKALSLADETKFLEISENILSETAKIFSIQFPGKKGIIIADENTYRVAGESVHRFLSESGLECAAPFIMDDPELYADYQFVKQVAAHLSPLDGIAVAVGSGVINDLTKLASHELGRPYMCIATAASMDGYSSFGASITKEGAKMTMPCAAPLAILADLDVISGAPAINNASGYADLYAKVPAGADWILADAFGAEALDTQSWHIVQDGLKEALADPAGVRAGTRSAIGPLTEGLMLGGFAMQSLRSSRPASGAEHQFSHLWDMEHHTFKGEMTRRFGLYKDQDEQVPSHGFKVGIGLLTTTALYERVLMTPLENLDIQQALARWKTLDAQISEVNDLFEDPAVKAFAIKQISDKYVTVEELEVQLTELKANWPEIREKLMGQIIPYKEAKEHLKRVGAPVECEQIGISRDRLRKSFYKAQKLRSRFTVLDMAVRTGYLDRWVAELFDQGGVLNQPD